MSSSSRDPPEPVAPGAEDPARGDPFDTRGLGTTTFKKRGQRTPSMAHRVTSLFSGFDEDDSEDDTPARFNKKPSLVQLNPSDIGRDPAFSSAAAADTDTTSYDYESSEDDKHDFKPLPTLPVVVLCIAMFGEFLSASTSSPFMYFMIEGFGVGQGADGGGEAAVGFWTGVVGSVFFLSQFCTSLLWVSVADKHGRRLVLFSSLLGNALTLAAFGMSRNLATAIIARLGMGVFNGAVGVARGAVKSIADPSNEARAFAYMSLCWGLGGIVGSIIGGLMEHPVSKYPYLFEGWTIFVHYPYLLPCLISASVTFTGSILCIFLNPDGGPRNYAIRLPAEKDTDTNSIANITRRIVSKASSYMLGRPATLRSSSRHIRLRPSVPDADAYTGTAYGYPTSPPPRPLNIGASTGFSRRFASLAGARSVAGTRTASGAPSSRFAYAPDYEQDFNFAQRLLLANESNVHSISDLWVAAATQNDDQYSQADYESLYGSDDEDYDPYADEDAAPSAGSVQYQQPLPYQQQPHAPAQQTIGFSTTSPQPSLDDLRAAAHLSHPRLRPQTSTLSILSVPKRTLVPRRSILRAKPSTGSALRHSSVLSGRQPSIYSNTGLDPASLGQPALPATDAHAGESAILPAIPETHAASDDSAFAPEADTSTSAYIKQLPLAMIAQYSILALHGCTCDQIFMSFLVTPVESSGLGLQAANYATLVAIMFFFQMVWQFFWYPNIGPPKGSLSHLAMLRLGMTLYIPVYLLFPQLRGLLRENSDGFVMFGMILLSSIRYLGNTCAYTAIMVLVSAMSPPHLVPLANGLAQSAVSLARFIGPLLGGSLWALSISGENPHPAYPFYIVAALCFIGLVHSARIR